MIVQSVTHCWRKIGVYAGDHSCARLKEVVHCRNCEVFAAAARSVLLRDVDALDPPADTEATLAPVTRSALLVRIGELGIGLPAARVIEIAADAPLRRIPHRSGRAIAGLINVRGHLHLALALTRVFGLEAGEPEADTQSRVVLLDAIAGAPVAFRVARVLGVHGFAEDQLGPVPETLPSELAEMTSQVACLGEDRYLLLDDNRLSNVLGEALNA
jgi:chemotaxis signal transduction protein